VVPRRVPSRVTCKRAAPLDERSSGGMNRTIEGATVEHDRDDSHDQLRVHLADFVSASNVACRLEALHDLDL